MYFVYVLKSQKDGRLYVGISGNVERRLKEHNAGYQFSTKGYRPWSLFYQKCAPNRIAARKIEIYFKSGCGKENLKKIMPR